jgi:Tannase and feruloyl esterase
MRMISRASKSYMLGCSGGGGQTLMEAERFPEDFDGYSMRPTMKR